MSTYTDKESCGQVFFYLNNMTLERPIYREFEKGWAIQRYPSGCYWDFSTGRWDNGCRFEERSEWEIRHGLAEYLD